ncbi:MAG: LysE family transporter [Eubacteriaceae bacterium]|nr:LysE family transporter [Eubacteriaceae bacterium]
MNYLLQGFLIGLAYVAPIGTQNIFVINTALTQKRSRVYTTALIVLFFDITISLACFFGIGAIMSAFKWLEMVVLGIGSLMVIYIGLSIVRSKAEMDSNTNVAMPVSKIIVTACVVTWFNPQAIIDGTMLLGAFKVSLPPGESFAFITGVCCASATWWLGLSTVVSLFKSKITGKALKIINIICGSIIIFYGCKLLISFIQEFV